MFRSEGFTEFVPKPIERTVLERVLRRVLPSRCVQCDEGPAEENGPRDVPRTVPAEEKNEAPAGAPEPAVPVDETALLCARLAQAGINGELGLNYCGGDEGFFRKMLRMFHAQSGDKKAEIAALYEAANWTDYAIKVHALKSTSLSIGAEALSAQAKELELAGKRGDGDFIRAHHPALMDAYDAVCAQLAGV